MGITPKMLKLTDGALRRMIDEYTMESGGWNPASVI